MDNDIDQQSLPETPQRTMSYEKASFSKRLLAFIIDQTILAVPYYIIVSITVPGLDSIASNVLLLVTVFSYTILFTWKKGATPGKMIVKIKVVSASYQPVKLGQVVWRETICKMISGIFDLGYFWVLIDKKKQAWHDKLARTFVISLDQTGNPISIADEEPVNTKHKVAFGAFIFLYLLPIIVGVGLLITYIFLFRPFQVNGNSMFPNYTDHEYLLTGIHYRTVQRGDVIIFIMPTDSERYGIKRIIGMPGDTIVILYGNVYVNQNRLDENKYLAKNSVTVGGKFLPEGKTITIPANDYFVMGDNRAYSSDSREWGFVPKENVLSKVLLCYASCPVKK